MNNSEEKIIKELILEVIKKLEKSKVEVGVSNKHLHISQKDLDILYGKGYELTKLKELKQPGQYASNETITLVGSKGKLEKVRILGPVRKNTQVEISISDSFKIGVNAPLRESGKLEGSGAGKIIGPKGEVYLEEGIIIPLRHIHMSKKYADENGFKDGDSVKTKIEGKRSCILENVLVRVSEKYNLEFHIDFDEANSCLLKSGDIVEIKK